MDLPVRARHVIGGPARQVVRLHVFCPAHRASISYDACRTCPRLDGLPRSAEEPGACISCRPVMPPRNADPVQGGDDAPFSSLGRGTPVGAIVGPRVVCISSELPARSIMKVFRDWGGTHVAVVDERGALLGSVRREDLMPSKGARFDPFAGAVYAGERMGYAASIRESDLVTRAAERIAYDRVRMLYVVDGDGAVTGTLSDLDLLRWLTRERRRVETELGGDPPWDDDGGF